ncbi:hypothetical protein V8C37DRAFT_416828 [Trichoderma ceciliae]
MATLAAIPEATSYLLDRNRIRYRDSLPTASFHRQRPKSRVVILSRRSSRVRTPTRKHSPPPVSPGSVYSSDARQAPEQHFVGVCSHEASKSPPVSSRRTQADKHSTYDARPPFHGSSMRSLDAGSSLDHSWEPSELSVDLDSFPLPPSKDPIRQPGYAGNPSTTTTKPSRSHTSPALPKPGTSSCFPKASFSPLQSRRRSHVCMHRSRRSSHSQLLDGAADLASASKHASIDSALVEAISRSVCQQLRLFTALSRSNQDGGVSRTSREAPPSRHGTHSWVPHQSKSNSLNRFTERRFGLSEEARLPRQHRNMPTTPTKSSISLHTVSPLLPFRPEFKAAGLAVTSKDQKRNFPAYIARLISSKPSHRHKIPSRGERSKVSRLDGLEEKDSSLSSMSEISFAPSQDMGEWRYALIDEAPVRKQKRRPAKEKKKSKRHWFPCFPRDEESISGDAVSRMPDTPPTPPPKPTPLILPQRNGRENGARPRADSSPRSPRHKSLGARDIERKAYEFDSQDNAYVNSYHGGHYDGEPNFKEHSCLRPRVKRAQTAQNPPTRHINPQGSQNHYQRQYQSLPLNRGLSGGSRFKSEMKFDQPRPSFDPDHIGVCCRSSRGVPAQANAPPNIPTRTSSMRESFPTSEDDCEGDSDVVDRDVLRGLHIAASAACDEEVDTFVRNRTGLRLRRFLADLMVLETLRDIHLDEGHGQGARQKRSTLRKLKQQVRRSREVGGIGVTA